LFQAANTITNATNTFVVDNSATVTFTAGSSITLLPGFSAIAGSGRPTFHATINPNQQTTGIVNQSSGPTLQREYIYMSGKVAVIENQ